jgi:hypothetical protein
VAFLVALGIGLSLGFRLGLYTSREEDGGTAERIGASTRVVNEMPGLECIPSDHCAMTVRIITDLPIGIITPGTRVDLITVEKDPDNPDQRVARVFLRHLSVLGHNIGSAYGEPPPQFLTVAVKPDEAELLAKMIRNGPPVAIMSKPEEALVP